VSRDSYSVPLQRNTGMKPYEKSLTKKAGTNSGSCAAREISDFHFLPGCKTAKVKKKKKEKKIKKKKKTSQVDFAAELRRRQGGLQGILLFRNGLHEFGGERY